MGWGYIKTKKTKKYLKNIKNFLSFEIKSDMYKKKQKDNLHLEN
jgi:hypothetical protein